jgi:hypothetical protein
VTLCARALAVICCHRWLSPTVTAQPGADIQAFCQQRQHLAALSLSVVTKTTTNARAHNVGSKFPAAHALQSRLLHGHTAAKAPYLHVVQACPHLGSEDTSLCPGHSTERQISHH